MIVTIWGIVIIHDVNGSVLVKNLNRIFHGFSHEVLVLPGFLYCFPWANPLIMGIHFLTNQYFMEWCSAKLTPDAQVYLDKVGDFLSKAPNDFVKAVRDGKEIAHRDRIHGLKIGPIFGGWTLFRALWMWKVMTITKHFPRIDGGFTTLDG